VSAVAYFRVVDAVKSVVAIEDVNAATDQIAQTTLRKVVGQHSLNQTLSETDKINLDVRKILDVSIVSWGVEVTLVELNDIQLPDSMKRAMARQAEAEREKRAKIINLQSFVEIAELGSFLAGKKAAAGLPAAPALAPSSRPCSCQPPTDPRTADLPDAGAPQPG
jgi:regulator of protease activity HflC (stomatin/prohibitin superfamily)